MAVLNGLNVVEYLGNLSAEVLRGLGRSRALTLRRFEFGKSVYAALKWTEAPVPGDCHLAGTCERPGMEVIHAHLFPKSSHRRAESEFSVYLLDFPVNLAEFGSSSSAVRLH